MTDDVADRRLMRLLAIVLTGLWAVTAIAIATAYRPGGPIDILVVVACFLPVLVAAAGIVWPPVAREHRHRVALAWVWIAAVVLAMPVLYGIANGLAAGGPQSLVPSFEAAYAGVLALSSMSVFSVVGLVHRRRRSVVFEERATLLTLGLSVALTAAVGMAFGFVAVANDQALRKDELPASRFGPTDPDLEPPYCDSPPRLGANAVVAIEAASSVDDRERGRARLDGRRGGHDESWGGSWDDPDGSGHEAYLRVGARAWRNEESDDPGAPGTTWQEVEPDPYEMAGEAQLTMDGPPHAIVAVPRGAIVAEDLGLEIVEGARARHCRTFMDGPTALAAFLPLRWLLYGASTVPSDDTISRWRGEMDWWVFADGELGRASVEVSGSRAETGWDRSGTRAVLRATLSATDRDVAVDVTAPLSGAPVPDARTTDAVSPSPTGGIPPGSQAPPPDASVAPTPTLESATG